MTIRLLVLAAALSAVTFAAPASAQDMPGFSVTAPDGTAAPSAGLELPGQWLLVYLAPGSAPSDRLLQSLGESWSDARAQRVIFIVSGTVEAAKAHLAAKGGDALAASARWYADQDRSAWKALGFTGTLAVSGMIGARADWKIDGVISDPTVLDPAVQAWIQ
jgi:hypothetical protein